MPHLCHWDTSDIVFRSNRTHGTSAITNMLNDTHARTHPLATHCITDCSAHSYPWLQTVVFMGCSWVHCYCAIIILAVPYYIIYLALKCFEVIKSTPPCTLSQYTRTRTLHSLDCLSDLVAASLLMMFHIWKFLLSCTNRKMYESRLLLPTQTQLTLCWGFYIELASLLNHIGTSKPHYLVRRKGTIVDDAQKSHKRAPMESVSYFCLKSRGGGGHQWGWQSMFIYM